MIQQAKLAIPDDEVVGFLMCTLEKRPSPLTIEALLLRATKKMAIPRSVLKARKIDFGMPIVGYLCCAEFKSPCLVGIVFSDGRRRFEDGSTIRTSRVQKVLQVHDHLLFETISGSRYVVCHWLYESGAHEAVGIVH